MSGSLQPGPTTLEICLFGRFRVSIDRTPIEEKRWTRKSAKSLVKLLALRPLNSLHREQIMDLLWAEESPETAVNNLNKAIHGARRAFEPNLSKGNDSKFILTSKNQVVLSSPGALRIDLYEFERFANDALRNDNLEAGQKAIELYAGELLGEDIYEDWIYLRRESMRILFRKTATKTATLHADKGDQVAGIEILKKLIVEDETDEHVHRLLMRLYAETGSKYQALKQFEQCHAALRTLGIAPERETVELERRIKSGEVLRIKHEPAPTAVVPAFATPHVEQLTFQSGVIRSARFLPDEKTIVFSAAWEGNPAELYSVRPESGELHSVGITSAEIHGVSATGEIAAGLNPKPEAYLSRATLVRISPQSDSILEVESGVQWADWHPSKTGDHAIAIVRDRDGKNCLEYPIGNVIFETSGWVSHPRFSADGKKLAFIDHPLAYDDRGCVAVIEFEKGMIEHRLLTGCEVSMMGLDWANDEIWYSGAHQGSMRMIKSVTLQGKERPVFRGTGSLTLQDIAENGDILVTENKLRVQSSACRESNGIERDLSWHDWTLLRDLTDDGERVLFEEAGISGGSELSAYIRNTDGTGTRKICDGSPIRFSPDGQSAIVRRLSPHQHLVLISLEDGEVRTLADPERPMFYQIFLDFFPDGGKILFTANEAGGASQVFTQKIAGGSPELLRTDREISRSCSRSISPDGKFAVLCDSDENLVICDLSNGKCSDLKGLEKGFWLIRWSGDGENLYVWQRGEIPAVVFRYNPSSAKLEECLRLAPKDLTGVSQLTGIILSPDARSYGFSYARESSGLFLMKGLS